MRPSEINLRILSDFVDGIHTTTPVRRSQPRFGKAFDFSLIEGLRGCADDEKQGQYIICLKLRIVKVRWVDSRRNEDFYVWSKNLHCIYYPLGGTDFIQLYTISR